MCFKHFRFGALCLLCVDHLTFLRVGRGVIGRPRRVNRCEASGMWYSDVKFSVTYLVDNRNRLPLITTQWKPYRKFICVVLVGKIPLCADLVSARTILEEPNSARTVLGTKGALDTLWRMALNAKELIIHPRPTKPNHFGARSFAGDRPIAHSIPFHFFFSPF